MHTYIHTLTYIYNMQNIQKHNIHIYLHTLIPVSLFGRLEADDLEDDECVKNELLVFFFFFSNSE
jgi:hypothetical protein